MGFLQKFSDKVETFRRAALKPVINPFGSQMIFITDTKATPQTKATSYLSDEFRQFARLYVKSACETKGKDYRKTVEKIDTELRSKIENYKGEKIYEGGKI